MNFISICSGIEAASVAFGPLGWKAVAFSEIEPFPCGVLAHHYPDVPNFGDMTDFRQWPEQIFESADAIVGGPPCQAFSVAGLRKGLDDARGNLTLTYAEMINHADAIRLRHGKPPVIVLYENVPGLLSDKSGAYGCFLAALAGEDDPLEPPGGGGWSHAGYVSGPQRTIAWRTFDAQYFGVAQRRRRVFVISSARKDFDPATVLFEFGGVRRDIAPSRQAGQAATHATAPCLTSSGRGVERVGDTRGQDPVVAVPQPYAVANCLTARMHKGINSTLDEGQTPVVTHTLRGEGFDASTQFGEIAGTLTARYDSSPCADRGMNVVAFHGLAPCEFCAHPFDHDALGRYGCPNCEGEGLEAGSEPIPINSMNALRNADADPTTGCGIGEAGEAMFTITKGHSHAVAQPIAFPANLSGTQHASTENLSPALAALNPTAVAFQERGRTDGRSLEIGGDVAYALTAPSGGGRAQERNVMTPAMQVRRLTPVECERLQGFPDNYTAIPWRKKPASDCPDGPRYKALGNSWAVPNVRWIGARIQDALQEAAQIQQST